MSSDNQEKIFIKVLNFIHDLNDVFGQKYGNIKLYNKFLRETPMENQKAVSKQNTIFNNFVKNNFDAILSKDVSKLKDTKILFSEKVFINIKEIIEETDEDTKSHIFQHLQLIAYLFTNNPEMKQALSNSYKTTNVGGMTTQKASSDDEESKFITNYMSKIEQTFSEQEFSDPMTATFSLLKNGVFTDMIKTLQTDITAGKLDVNKLLGNVQGMMSEIGANAGGQAGETLDISKMMSGMNLEGMLGGAGGMAGMMDMVSGILSSTNETPQIEDLDSKKDKDL